MPRAATTPCAPPTPTTGPRPGDVVLLDPNRRPRPGDLVAVLAAPGAVVLRWAAAPDEVVLAVVCGVRQAF